MIDRVGQERKFSGLARMDEFEATASWDLGGDDSVVVKFDRDKMSPEKRTQLDRFRIGNPPIMLQLAEGECRKAMIVGYGARDNSFYLTWL